MVEVVATTVEVDRIRLAEIEVDLAIFKGPVISIVPP